MALNCSKQLRCWYAQFHLHLASYPSTRTDVVSEVQRHRVCVLTDFPLLQKTCVPVLKPILPLQGARSPTPPKARLASSLGRAMQQLNLANVALMGTLPHRD